VTYDTWKTRSPDDGVPQALRCVRCNTKSSFYEDDEGGEFVCESCLTEEEK
jgi:hypothetical protein